MTCWRQAVMNSLIKDKDLIEQWLISYAIKDYTILEHSIYGFVVNVNSDVDLFAKELSFIPVKFNCIEGNFNCSYNQLVNLVGCPDRVEGNFNCSWNKLINLEHCPSSIGGSLYCEMNKLNSLSGCPEVVKADMIASSNNLMNLSGAPSKVLGVLDLKDNFIGSINVSPECEYNTVVLHNNPLTIKDLEAQQLPQFERIYLGKYDDDYLTRKDVVVFLEKQSLSENTKKMGLIDRIKKTLLSYYG